ncbi:hypothetical protein ACOME3_008723 [Neoechinorhynchus agilis]
MIFYVIMFKFFGLQYQQRIRIGHGQMQNVIAFLQFQSDYNAINASQFAKYLIIINMPSLKLHVLKAAIKLSRKDKNEQSLLIYSPKWDLSKYAFMSNVLYAELQRKRYIFD